MVGCSSDDVAPVDAFAMEAWIDSDGYPVVLLTRAISPSDKPIPVGDVMVKWAKVTISDGEDTWVLTGGMDDTVFPPYSYRSFSVKGKVGVTYTVTADYLDTHAHASSTMLPPPEILSIDYLMTDNGYNGQLKFSAPDVTDTCRYVLFTRVRGRDSRHYPAFMGTAISTVANQECSMSLSPGKYIGIEKYSPYFQQGDSVDIILAHVDAVAYRFWQTYEHEVFFGNNIFISSPASAIGNVVGGYGLFSARGTCRQLSIVKDK